MTTKDSGRASQEEASGQWNRVGKRLTQDMPRLSPILLRAVQSSKRVSPLGDQPFPRMWAHLWSLHDVSLQALYTLERLSVFVCRQSSTPADLYMKFYLYGFMSRLKTATDLVGLILNVLFELGLSEKVCSLEKGKVCAALRKCANPNDRHAAVASHWQSLWIRRETIGSNHSTS